VLEVEVGHPVRVFFGARFDGRDEVGIRHDVPGLDNTCAVARLGPNGLEFDEETFIVRWPRVEGTARDAEIAPSFETDEYIMPPSAMAPSGSSRPHRSA
jgi:hypothetical protein